MRKFKRFINLQLPVVHFLSVLVALLFLCAEYKNPFDPKFEGNYDFKVNLGDYKSDSLEILKWYSFTISVKSDTFKDFTYKFSGDMSSITIDSAVDTVIKAYFTDKYEGMLQITGIRPNEKEITRQCTLKVENPYYIEGKEKIGIGELVKLSIKRTPTVGYLKNFENVSWNCNGVDTTLSSDSAFSFRPDSAGLINVQARLNGTGGNFATLNDTITCKGNAPQIYMIAFTDTLHDTISIDSFPMGVPFFMYITVKDKDNASNALSLMHNKATVFSNNLIDTGVTKKYYVSLEINDTSSHKFEIMVTDSDSLKDSTTRTIRPRWQPPEIKIIDSVEIPYNESTFVPIVKSSSRLSKIIWNVYNTSKNTIQQTDTVPGNTIGFTIDSIGDTSSKYHAVVVPVDKFGYFGKPDTCTIIPRIFTYRLYINGSDIGRSDTVKFKQSYQIKCLTKVKDSIVTPGITYSWSFTPPFDTLKSYLSSYEFIKSDSSELKMVFRDSVLSGPVHISVKGHLVDSTTQEITSSLLVRLFKPTCSVNNKDTAYINSPDSTLFTVVAMDTADKSGPPGAVIVQYRLDPDLPWNLYNQSKGITFRTAGNQVVYFKAKDSDSLFSAICSTSVEVISNKPYVQTKEIIRTITNHVVPLNEIKAQQATGGQFPIDSVYWDLDNNGSFETVTTSDIRPALTRSDTGTFTIRVYCTDTRLTVPSDTVSITISIVSDKPEISKASFSPEIQFINTPVSITFSVTYYNDTNLTAIIDTNGALFYTDKFVKAGNDTLHCPFTNPGQYKLWVRVIDPAGKADTAILSDSLIIDKGVPVINSIIISPADTIYINDTFNISTQVTENDSISKWYFSIDSTTSNPSLTSIKKDLIITSGQHIIYVRVQDNDGNLSDWKSDTITIYNGTPDVRTVTSNDSAYFIHNQATFTARLYDINGMLKRIDIQWKSDTTHTDFEQKSINKLSGDTVIITHQFEIGDTGSKTIYFRVFDEDGVSSGWRGCPIKVLKGEPLIKKVTKKSSHNDTVFIKDTIRFTLFGSDPNSVNGIRANISWDGDTIFEDTGKQLTNDSLLINHTFSTNSDTTITRILFRVIDLDSLFIDYWYPITVRSGAPIIDSLVPDTVFVKDTRQYAVFAHDPDGPSAQCDSFAVKVETSWIESKTGSISYTFNDTNPSAIGKRSVTIRTRDENYLWTEKVCTVVVDLGRPVISGFNNYGNANIQWVEGLTNTTDTMFYKWLPGQPTLVAVDTTDNDSCVSYFWNWDSDDFIDETTSIPRLPITGLRSNQANKVTVTGTDNDNINSFPYPFFVFPDGPPPVPLRFIEQSDGDSLRLLWNDTTDLKDGGETQFKVLYKFGTEGNPDLVAITNIAQKNIGTQTISGDNYNYVKISSTVSTWVRWQVIVKDARGSESASEIRQYYYSK